MKSHFTRLSLKCGLRRDGHGFDGFSRFSRFDGIEGFGGFDGFSGFKFLNIFTYHLGFTNVQI